MATINPSTSVAQAQQKPLVQSNVNSPAKTVQTATPQAPNNQTATSPQLPKAKTPWWAWLLIILGIIIIAGGALLFFNVI